MRGRYWLLLAAALLLAVVSLPILFAEDDEAKRERLQLEVEKLTAELQHAHLARDRESRQLAEVEVKISALAATLHQTELKTEEAVNRLQVLLKDLRPIEERLAIQRRLLKQQVRSTFLMGRQQQLRFILSLDDPSRISRISTYYHYLIRVRSAVIQDVTQTHHQLLETGRKVRNEERRLQALKSAQSQLLHSLQTMRDSRQQALHSWSEKIRSTDARLKVVRENAVLLEQLTQRLQQHTAEQVAASVDETGGEYQSDSPVQIQEQLPPFPDSRGNLPWPLRGRLMQRFGDRLIGDVELKGLVIEAETGSQVHAVYPGKVVFADWLRGYGLLMIIDHGDGFMSLYGYNQSLLKSVGDDVRNGEVISLSGESGGQQQASLYFAIRQGAKSFDPMRWCVRAEGKHVG
ncbi:MAG: peptidoglycan DD-metalloendopeptidase family protein [Pseudomonadota bacterium]